jgi:hypothetical protein
MSTDLDYMWGHCHSVKVWTCMGVFRGLLHDMVGGYTARLGCVNQEWGRTSACSFLAGYACMQGAVSMHMRGLGDYQ